MGRRCPRYRSSVAGRRRRSGRPSPFESLVVATSKEEPELMSLALLRRARLEGYGPRDRPSTRPRSVDPRSRRAWALVETDRTAGAFPADARKPCLRLAERRCPDARLVTGDQLWRRPRAWVPIREPRDRRTWIEVGESRGGHSYGGAGFVFSRVEQNVDERSPDLGGGRELVPMMAVTKHASTPDGDAIHGERNP